MISRKERLSFRGGGDSGPGRRSSRRARCDGSDRSQGTRVAVISTGDEVIPVQEKTKTRAGERHQYLHPRCILVRRKGQSRCLTVCAGTDFEQLRNTLLKGLETADHRVDLRGKLRGDQKI